MSENTKETQKPVLVELSIPEDVLEKVGDSIEAINILVPFSRSNGTVDGTRPLVLDQVQDVALMELAAVQLLRVAIETKLRKSALVTPEQAKQETLRSVLSLLAYNTSLTSPAPLIVS